MVSVYEIVYDANSQILKILFYILYQIMSFREIEKKKVQKRIVLDLNLCPSTLVEFPNHI